MCAACAAANLGGTGDRREALHKAAPNADRIRMSAALDAFSWAMKNSGFADWEQDTFTAAPVSIRCPGSRGTGFSISSFHVMIWDRCSALILQVGSPVSPTQEF